MNNTTLIPEWKLIIGIVHLLIQADTNLTIAERFLLIKESLPPYKSPEYEFLRFVWNNWFSESINLLHTILFWYTKPWKEEFVLPDDGNSDLKKIKDDPFLKIVRNHTTNHKSTKLKQPAWTLYNQINPWHIQKTREIIEELKLYLLKKYNYSTSPTNPSIILYWLDLIIQSSKL